MEENREVKREKVRSIPIEQIEDFPEHPFKIQNRCQRREYKTMAIISAIKAIAPTVKELVAIIVAGGWGVIIILVISLLAVVVGVVDGAA